MEWFPALKLGWRNGWLLWALLSVVQGVLLLASSREVRARLFDRSRWGRRGAAIFTIGKLFSLICLVLVALTPLTTGPLLTAGVVVYAAGLAALSWAILDFRATPPGEPVTRGLYRISRHPQLTAQLVAFAGVCLAIGSWAALLALVISRVLQHWGVLAEEEACLAQYGDSYRAYMRRVPRYFLFF